MRCLIGWSLMLLPLWASAGDAQSAPPMQTLDFGIQPLALPHAMFGALLARDGILRRQLAVRRIGLATHPFYKGDDMVPLMAGDALDVATLGDMPTLSAAAAHEVAVVGMVKQTFSSIVGKHYMPLSQLKGLRVGCAPGSSAYYTLLHGLSSVGLSDKDVTLVAMENTELPEALSSGRIDAFSAWEPAPTVALKMGKEFAVIYRGVNSAYLVFNRALLDAQPDAACEVGAAFVRALRWMQKSERNLLQAAEWVLADGVRFSGKASRLVAKDAAEITRREILDVLSAPLIPSRLVADDGVLNREFDLLKTFGKLPPQAAWRKAKDSFDPAYLQEIVAAPAKYRLNEFDYPLH